MIGANPSPSVPSRRGPARGRAALQEGWVLANHILVSFHAAFLSAVLALPDVDVSRGEVLQFVFVSPETLVSAVFLYITFHVGIAFHELGHFLTAARLNALNESVAGEVAAGLSRPGAGRWLYLAKVFALAPWGRAAGIKRQGLNYYPDAPYNLAVAAAGPRMSRNVACVALPPAVLLIAFGLLAPSVTAVYLGRLLLGIGIVTGLDFLIADPGKYREFKEREEKAREAASALAPAEGWLARAPAAKARLIERRMQEVLHPHLGPVCAPWQFRNCGMGGRHTEKEYPESNISMQEAMFLILGARDYLDAQEMTVALQTRLKEIIENAEGCRVMGIGLEGGLAPYIDPGDTPLPEVRLWVMMKQAIEECGYRPGEDVAIALDPAMGELEIAYREEFGVPDSVGMYLFWRDERNTVLDREGVIALFDQAVREFEIPVLSIEDGFSEDDYEGWKRLNDEQGDRLLIIGDDLVTTNDATIEDAADRGLINSALIKANQIGTLHETLLAMLVALGKGLTLVVSHRSKSPNDDMEAHIALATNALGLKAGGGANTERLIKYHAVATQLAQVDRGGSGALPIGSAVVVEDLFASEEPTNAGVPTVGSEVRVRLFDGQVRMAFRGATPLGTSAGSGEAVHLVDAVFAGAEHPDIVSAHRTLLDEVEPGLFAFRDEVTREQVRTSGDEELDELFARARRYKGKGCLNAVDNVREVLAPYFRGRDLAQASLLDIDRALLQLERQTAERRGRLDPGAGPDEAVAVMQRKAHLGMNAVLSVSLALARAVALVRGLDLWELLREEMVGIVERLADAHDTPIAGSRFEDYVEALRKVSGELARKGIPLHQELRQLTHVYDDPQLAPPSSLPVPGSSEVPRQAAEAAVTAGPAALGSAVSACEAASARSEVGTPLRQAQLRELEEVSADFYRSFVQDGGAALRRSALRRYVRFRTETWKTLRPFELVNDKLIVDGEHLLVPYLAGDDLLLHRVTGDEVTLERRPIVPGTILTDALLAEQSGVHGEAIDLEDDLYGYEVESLPEFRVARIRDMTGLLRELENSPNYYRAAVYLRSLVVRLCGKSFSGFLGAKNLRPEVTQLDAEIVRVLDLPFADRLKLPMRILVRSVSALLLRPSLIDQVWTDAIDLAEIHVPGSRIANELRRSSHHALGVRTLALAEAYHRYLESGSRDALIELGFESVSEADQAARGRTAARTLVERIRSNLEKLLGRSEIVGRIREWQDAYAEALVRCEFGTSLTEELDAIVNGGIQARNRWVFRHHLRIVARKADEVANLLPGPELQRDLAALEDLDPAADDFDAVAAENDARAVIAQLVGALRVRCLKRLFTVLDDILAAHDRDAFLDTVRRVARLRADVGALIDEAGFREQRYLLYQLDFLLEEMAYLAVRQIAGSYEERGVLEGECFEIVQILAGSLVHGGLRSDALCDLAAMLCIPGRSDSELLDVLDALQDCYHRVVQRNSLSFEALGQLLEISTDDLRIVLANLQRYLHDLNGIVHLTDLAKSHILARSQRAQGEPAEAAELFPFDILHLSHVDEIEKRMADPHAVLRDRYGAKGGGLLRISHAGIPTRDGFILPTHLGRSGAHESDAARFEEEIRAHLEILVRDIARREGQDLRFGDREHPLLLAVRGGSSFSMPGILPTIVFVGINDEIVESLAGEDPWYAYDSYRRFLTSWGAAVMGVELERFDLVEQAKRRHDVRYKDELPWEAMRDVVEGCKRILREQGSSALLDQALADPHRQLTTAVRAVLAGWNTDRARRYRAIKGLSDGWNTAVIIQHMASGNRRNADVREGMDEARCSLTGVIPHTMVTRLGMRELTGDIKFSASGDDLVGGLTAADSFEPIERLRSLMPMLERRLDHIGTRIRMLQGTDVELEFTVERGVLSILQVRTATTARNEDVASFDEPGDPVSTGIGIRGGAFRGRVAFGEQDVAELTEQRGAEADGVLVVLENPTPDEIPLILSAGGLLAARGGSTSHAAVAVHGIQDRPFSAVLGVTALRVDTEARRAVFVDAEGRELAQVRKGEVVCIDGRTGSIWIGTRSLLKASEQGGSA